MKELFTILLMLAAINAFGQWQPDVRLTNDPGESFTSYNNARFIASNGPVVHVVWRDNWDGNYEIYYKRSTDAGVTWGVYNQLTNNAAVSDYPSIAVSGPVVHVVWYDYRDGNLEIYYKRSMDAGITWGADIRLTNNPAWSGNPSVAVSGSVVNIVWFDDRDGNYEIYYKRSTDAGFSWGSDIRLTTDSASSYNPSIAVFGSNVHVVWHNFIGGDNKEKIYYKRSTDFGVSWDTEIRLTNNTTVSSYPSIAVTGTIIHVVWQDYRDINAEIYYKRSTNGGISWDSDRRLTNDPNFSGTPSVAVSNSAVHIVWRDDRNGLANSEIYYKSSSDFGLNWSDDIRLTNNIGNSLIPSIALSGSVVHILWHDYRDGNSEIYYKRNPTANSIGIQNISTEIPSSYSLSQNYPNPFNPFTNVKFSIVKSRQVKLIVYDIKGREVQTLVNETLQPGTYETSFDGSTLNSGVYFYKLVTDGFTVTKKMILIK